MEQKLSYFEIICYFRVLKNQYEGFLTPFFNTTIVRSLKTYVYSLPISQLKRDLLWCYLNDDIDLAAFLNSLN